MAAASRYGPQVRAIRRQADRPGRPGRADRLPDLAALHRPGPRRAAARPTTGAAVLEAIAADPVRHFGALRGVSARQAEAAAESWYASRAVRDLHVQLAPHGLAHLAAPIHARYGAEAMQVLHEDPYGLTEIDGVGFARADAIALAADVPPESDRRAQAAAAYVLGEAERQGHTYLPLARAAPPCRRAARHRPRPRRARRRRRPAARGRSRLPASRPTPADLGARRRCGRGPAPPR